MSEDILDAVTESAPIDIDKLMEESAVQTVVLPEASVRNQAAMTSLLSDDPTKVVDNYQLMRIEMGQGRSYVRDSIHSKANKAAQADNDQAFMSILADPSISVEQKKAVIAGMKSDFNRETSTLVSFAAAKQPSKGEDHEAESVRISGQEQFRDIIAARQGEQELMNKAWVRANPAFGTLLTQTAETMVAPFATNKLGAGVVNEMLTILGEKESKAKSAILPGSAIKKVIEKYQGLPAQDKVFVQKSLYDLVMNTDRVMFTKDNDYVKAELINKVLGGQDYSNFDMVLDNAVGVLDLIGVGSMLKSGAKKVTSLFTKTPENVNRNVQMRATTALVSPVSPVKILEDSNPSKARSAFSMIVKSEDDEAALALTGATRQDAIADMTVPQPASVDNSVKSKLIEPDREIIKEVEETGAIHLSDVEKRQAGALVYNNIKNVNGLTIHDNLAAVGVEGNQMVIKALYGTSEGGFLKADEAFNQVKFSLREYGIQDSDLTLMVKKGDEYVPTTLEEAKGIDGNYLVQLNTKHRINATDIVEMDKETVKRNFFDSIPYFRTQNSGTIANHIMDNASMLSKRYTGAAVVATDKAVRIDKLFLQLHSKFSDGYKNLAKDRQSKVYEYLKEANLKELELDTNQLVGRGFNADEINLINTWRKNWDTHFWFENQDLVKNLSHQGFKVFDSTTTNTKLFAKEIPKNQNISKVYDPSTDSIKSLSKQEMDDLYNTGGSYAVFRRPIDVNGVSVEHMIVRNTPTEYLRGLRDTDQVLNYRKGYYQVHYNAPKYIVEKVKDASGNFLYNKARMVAGDTAEGEQLRQRLASTSGKSVDDFFIRNDLNELRIDTDAYWDLQNSNGRVAQRRRGKRLEDSSGPLTGLSDQYIADPVESAIRASRSLSGRIATRDFLEVSKQRAMRQYSDFFPSNGKGEKMWVENSNSLVSETSRESKEIADARTTVEYLNYLQHGYVNSLDNFFKSGMNVIANLLSKTSSKGERAFLWMGDSKPTEFLKSGVFQVYIATNPLRQLLIQGHQMVRLLGYNPQYVLGKGVLDGQAYFRYTSGLADIKNATKEEREMIEFVQKSGMLDAVDKHNLVRGSLSDLAENSSATKKVIGTGLAGIRKVGFDLGEQWNLFMHLGAVRDKFIREGKDVTNLAVRDEAYSYVRALSYDMNFAGDMAYNQNSLGLFLQFLQVPHKAFLSFTNRRIRGTVNPFDKEFYKLGSNDRLRLASVDMLLFGIPGAAAISNMVGKDMLPEDPKQREAVLFGLTSVGWNGGLSAIAGKDVKVDFSGLSPYGYDGFAHLLHAVTSGGTLEFIQNSPAYSLYLKEGGKTQEAFGRMFRYFGFVEPELDKPTLMQTLKGFAEISSGWSNTSKALTIIETGKVVDKATGKPIMEDADYWYGVAQLFGFKSQKEVYEWAALKEMNEFKKGQEEDWKKVYDSYLRILVNDMGMRADNPDAVNTLLGIVKSRYKNDFEAQEWFAKKLSQDMVNRQDTVTKKAIESAGFVNAEQVLSNTKTLLKQPEYQKVETLFNDMQIQINKAKEE